MAIFDVCATVNVTGGSSFQWNNPKAFGVKITPVTSWILPQQEYDIAAGATTSAINVPAVSVGQTFQISVHWLISSSPGIPCSGAAGNPKIVVSANKPSFDAAPPAKKAKPRKKKSKAPAKKAKPPKKKSKPPAKKKRATAKKKKKH